MTAQEQRRALNYPTVDLSHAVRSDACVLFTGDEKTAEALARRLHNMSGWRQGPFVPVDCRHAGRSLESQLVQLLDIEEHPQPTVRLADARAVRHVFLRERRTAAATRCNCVSPSGSRHSEPAPASHNESAAGSSRRLPRRSSIASSKARSTGASITDSMSFTGDLATMGLAGRVRGSRLTAFEGVDPEMKRVRRNGTTAGSSQARHRTNGREASNHGTFYFGTAN